MHLTMNINVIVSNMNLGWGRVGWVVRGAVGWGGAGRGGFLWGGGGGTIYSSFIFVPVTLWSINSKIYYPIIMWNIDDAKGGIV